MEATSLQRLCRRGTGDVRLERLSLQERQSLALWILGENIAGVAVDRFETNDVLRAQPGDGSVQQRLGSSAETDFAGHIKGDLVARLAAHELHGFADAALREDVEEWRLSQVDGQSLLPVLRMRLAAPTVVVDLGQIAELRGVREDGDALVIGAMTTHYDVQRDPLSAEQSIIGVDGFG